MSTSSPRFVQILHMGLGDAIQRLTTVEFQVRMGTHLNDAAQEERKLLLEALNHIPIEVGFDCNADGSPDSVSIFREAAATSCCRLLPIGASIRRKKVSTERRALSAPAPCPVSEAPKKKFLGLFGGGGDSK